MNDWVHCNKCSQKYNPNVKLLLTECGHMFCERCKDSNNINLIIQLLYFLVYNFQTQNTTRLLRTTRQKYEYAKKECISCHKRNKVLTRELRILKTMLMSMGQNPQPFLTSTPATGSDTLQGDNMSMSSIRFTPNNTGPDHSRVRTEGYV
ncbi:hypothetical protein NQ317_011628 [Molorchus minor]|uniref:RING-type domain-containing protein n=1 Tax=Molorchus minor TaxID=1323400 RepID=A0ABQ9IRU7_9CUCU|nr:hypothetical protein NQ317_011628 [Molorchus minor]